MSGLAGKVALVTGAASGIGASAVAALEAAGARVLGTDIRASGALFPHDVTDEAQWDAAIAEVVKRFGRLDILVSNAGTAQAGPIVDLALADFRAQCRVHVEGAFLGIRAAVAQMRAQGAPARGSIIVMASVAGLKPIMQTTAYGTAKAALINLARAVGVEVGRKGDLIRVNAICPGLIGTSRMDDVTAPGPVRDMVMRTTPLGREGWPEEVGELAAFLCGPGGDYITGQAIEVDGGMVMS